MSFTKYLSNLQCLVVMNYDLPLFLYHTGLYYVKFMSNHLRSKHDQFE